MSPSKKLFYAVEAVLYIAYNSGQGPISSRDIAARQGLPARYLEQLMQKLVRGGVLKGIRGPHGGYLLAKERRRITIADIREVLSEEKDDTENYGGTKLGQAVVLPVWHDAQRRVMEYLKQVNLAELCDQAQNLSIAKESEENMDFVI